MFWPRTQVIEVFSLVAALEALLTEAPLMASNDDEFLALMAANLAPKDQLLLGELEGLAN